MYKGLSPAEIEKVEGNALFKRGKIQEAINRYSKGLDMLRGDPKEEKDKQTKADLYANRAACYVQLYEPTKVRDDCNAALTLVPNHFKALLRRGQANEALEKYKAAAEDFQAALRMHPEDKLAVQSLSRVQKAQKQMAG
jgi:tetratricopeptide (TPR) repeat protein